MALPYMPSASYTREEVKIDAWSNYETQTLHLPAPTLHRMTAAIARCGICLTRHLAAHEEQSGQFEGFEQGVASIDEVSLCASKVALLVGFVLHWTKRADLQAFVYSIKLRFARVLQHLGPVLVS